MHIAVFKFCYEFSKKALTLQLQHIVCDEAPQECIEIFHQELKKGGAGGLYSTSHQRIHAEMAYQKRLEQLLADENCFKVFVVSFIYNI